MDDRARNFPYQFAQISKSPGIGHLSQNLCAKPPRVSYCEDRCGAFRQPFLGAYALWPQSFTRDSTRPAVPALGHDDGLVVSRPPWVPGARDGSPPARLTGSGCGGELLVFATASRRRHFRPGRAGGRAAPRPMRTKRALDALATARAGSGGRFVGGRNAHAVPPWRVNNG